MSSKVPDGLVARSTETQLPLVPDLGIELQICEQSVLLQIAHAFKAVNLAGLLVSHLRT